MMERRRWLRRHVLHRGDIVLNGGHGGIGCVVLDVSAGGARLKVGQWLGLPDTFDLRIENGATRKAEVRHRDMELTRVSFRDAG
jgi:PilZ domain